jgi:hypothetical protein
MIILLECSLNINRYIKEILADKREIACPCCSRRLRKHGSYERRVVWRRRIHTIPILRRRCPSCDVTFSLLPCFLIPGMRFANHIREFMARWLGVGLPLAQLPAKLSSVTVSVLSVRTLRRWKAVLWNRWEKWLLKQRTKLAITVDDGAGLLPLYREGLNSEQERHLLLASFFSPHHVLPPPGAVLSAMNLRLPPHMRW